jgi:hypothetical protein
MTQPALKRNLIRNELQSAKVIGIDATRQSALAIT